MYVCCHKTSFVPENDLLFPIQVGAALTDSRFPGFLYDDEGENISKKNRSYCELTAQHWAWKNSRADYLGFFHYRRYLYPDPDARFPYRIASKPNAELLKRLGYEDFAALIRDHDMIMPIGENMHVSVRDHYASAPCHIPEDLVRMEKIIKEYCPDYIDAMEQYFSGSVHYFGNIHIMRRELFKHYCEWLFPLLDMFDQETDFSSRNAQEMRADGYLGERLLGVYYTRHKNEWKTLELPRVHFDALDGSPDWKGRAAYLILPPGTKRRAWVKDRIKT